MHPFANLLKQHRTLLADDVRLSAYAEAIAAAVRPDDVVLDLGSGTGILAMLAARAGARRVFAIEREHIVDAAAIIARQNGLPIEWFHQQSAEVELPERATLLITETLGNLGFDEGILGSVLDARRRLLTSEARIVPQSISLLAAPVEASGLHQKRVGFWSTSRQGIDLSVMRTFASNQIWIADFAPSTLLASPERIAEVSLRAMTSAVVSGSAEFTIARAATLHGFGAWFSAQLTDHISLSNAPPLHTPNWRHGFLPLDTPVDVAAGAMVHVEIETNDGNHWRWRGSVEGTPFDQMTQFGFAPCMGELP